MAIFNSELLNYWMVTYFIMTLNQHFVVHPTLISLDLVLTKAYLSHRECSG